MSNKKNIIYLMYCILIIILYFVGTSIFVKFDSSAANSYSLFYRIFVTLTPLIFYGTIGIILGMEGFLIELRKVGKWKFNIPKFLILGIPSLFFSIPYVVTSFITFNFFMYGNIYFISPIIFGYTLISSVSKTNN